MRIAIVSTVYQATPPRGYGGIERVVHTLTEELARQGHDVTLFGARGSRCSGRTVEVAAFDPSRAPSGVRKGSDVISEQPLYEAMCDYLRDNPVDVIHDWSFQNLYVLRHPESHPFVVSTCIPPGDGYARPNLVACSRAHAEVCGNGTRFVHYGLDLERWRYSFAKGRRLIHIAKIARYKGQHHVIRAARMSRCPVILAGNVEDRWYYRLVVRGLMLVAPSVSYIGEIYGTNEHLMEARALIQAPLWFDAFPLVILESLASGTPVIAFDQGGIREQIEHGANGFLCRTTADLAEAMNRVDEISPRVCRETAQERYSVTRMAREYTELYDQVRDGVSW